MDHPRPGLVRSSGVGRLPWRSLASVTHPENPDVAWSRGAQRPSCPSDPAIATGEPVDGVVLHPRRKPLDALARNATVSLIRSHEHHNPHQRRQRRRRAVAPDRRAAGGPGPVRGRADRRGRCGPRRLAPRHRRPRRGRRSSLRRVDGLRRSGDQGLALVNGTDGMLAMLVLAVSDMRELLVTAARGASRARHRDRQPRPPEGPAARQSSGGQDPLRRLRPPGLAARGLRGSRAAPAGLLQRSLRGRRGSPPGRDRRGCQRRGRPHLLHQPSCHRRRSPGRGRRGGTPCGSARARRAKAPCGEREAANPPTLRCPCDGLVRASVDVTGRQPPPCILTFERDAELREVAEGNHLEPRRRRSGCSSPAWTPPPSVVGQLRRGPCPGATARSWCSMTSGPAGRTGIVPPCDASGRNRRVRQPCPSGRPWLGRPRALR